MGVGSPGISKAMAAQVSITRPAMAVAVYGIVSTRGRHGRRRYLQNCEDESGGVHVGAIQSAG